MRALLPLALLCAACGTRGTYRSPGEVPIVVWLRADREPDRAFSRPEPGFGVDLHGPVGVVDGDVVYVFRTDGSGDWRARHAVVFTPTGERIENRHGPWAGYRRAETEHADRVVAKLAREP